MLWAVTIGATSPLMGAWDDTRASREVLVFPSTRRSDETFSSLVFASVYRCFVPAVPAAAGCSPRLGLAVCTDGLGEDAQHGEDRRLLCQPQYSFPVSECPFCGWAGVFRRNPADSRAGNAPGRVVACIQHVRRIL